jgi:hypothetical protein
MAIRPMFTRRGLSRTLIVVLSLALCVHRTTAHSQSSANDALKIVDNPGGGQFVYGSLNGQSSQADAMVFMLRQVHGHFGEKPQVGKLLRSRDNTSMAIFFTLNAKLQGGKPMAGMVIVSMPAGRTPQAAVLYDDSNRFATTEPGMVKALTSAWQKSGVAGTSAQNGNAAGDQGGAVALSRASGGDGSASIGLPAGWHITRVSGGALIAEGPHHEIVSQSLFFQGIVDPRRQQNQFSGFGRSTGNGSPVVCALTRDLFTAFTCIIAQTRRNQNMSAASFTLISQRTLNEQGVVPPVEAIYKVDYHDGVGPRRAQRTLRRGLRVGNADLGAFCECFQYSRAIRRRRKRHCARDDSKLPAKQKCHQRRKCHGDERHQGGERKKPH